MVQVLTWHYLIIRLGCWIGSAEYPHDVIYCSVCTNVWLTSEKTCAYVHCVLLLIVKLLGVSCCATDSV